MYVYVCFSSRGVVLRKTTDICLSGVVAARPPSAIRLAH